MLMDVTTDSDEGAQYFESRWQDHALGSVCASIGGAAKRLLGAVADGLSGQGGGDRRTPAGRTTWQTTGWRPASRQAAGLSLGLLLAAGHL
jgi:hypothetical protein